MRTHTGEKRKWSQSNNIKFKLNPVHHQPIRPSSLIAYKCKYCDRGFAQSNDLVKHLRSHVGENTYQCQNCPRAFRLHSELREHSKTHFQRGDETENKAEPNTESGPGSDAETMRPSTNEPIKDSSPKKLVTPVNVGSVVQLSIQSGAAGGAQISSKSIIIAPGQVVGTSTSRRLVIQPLGNNKVAISQVALQQLESAATVKHEEIN